MNNRWKISRFLISTRFNFKSKFQCYLFRMKLSNLVKFFWEMFLYFVICLSLMKVWHA